VTTAAPEAVARPRLDTGRILTGLALATIALLVASALLAPWIAPFDPADVDLDRKLLPAGAAHWLGTDHLGRDLLSRLLHGARVSLGSVAGIFVLVMAIGLAVGCTAGSLGGGVDAVLMRAADAFMTIPTIVLAVFLIGVLGTGLDTVIVAIALSHWAWYARMVRGLTLSLRHRDYVLAARLAGTGRVMLVVRHLLPAIAGQLAVLATLDLGHWMLHVSALSFLGLGVAPPGADWGVMISDARPHVWRTPMLVVWPGLMLFVTVMAFNLVGDRIRDRLDPALRLQDGH
jgi:nickel transport system permease protein